MNDIKTLSSIEQRVSKLTGIFKGPRIGDMNENMSIRDNIFGVSAIRRHA